MAKYRDGDLFAIPLPDRDWLTGRILLDVDRVLAGKQVDASSPFRSRKHLVLVEVYAEPSAEPSDRVSKTLIPGAWVDPDAITGREDPRWPIVGHRPIDPEQVDFPENMFDVRGETTFEQGELRKKVPVPTSELDRYQCNTMFLLPSRFIKVCCYYLGRKQHLGAKPELFSLQRVDLRFSPYREEVHRLMGEDPNRGYFERATGAGLAPARLWA